ncbi:MAG: type II toxin-antitoxin system RatA family toxin [Sphingobacteriia bacterium]|nr:type II toxin-antitoxin system RatA family toxin [Sphingobacteriia bacterium]
MPERKLHRISPYSVEQLYTLVLDIESYPEFIPWCTASRILSYNDKEIIADLVIGFSGFREKYTSKVTKTPYSSDTKQAKVIVELMEGPFTHLDNFWVFTETENGTIIDFDISFKFNSKILEKVIGIMFEKALFKMIDSFEKRADQLYGK